uniref:phosphatidylinositol-3,5-bisphosphate 3-phosphatase n=1 Tax=Wuchereria bancrofti TaxID=6293 RepID=A0AAF5PP36_WUCBA
MSLPMVSSSTDEFEIARLLLIDGFKRLYETIMGHESLRDDDLILYCGLLQTVNKVQLIDRLGSEPNIVGSIHVTTSHVIFKAEDSAKEIWVPNGLIGTVEKGMLSVLGTPLTVKCKHFLTLTFLITRDKECQDLVETLNKCGKPVNITDVFAFENKERNGDICLNAEKRGWDRFDWAVEFARQGIGTADDRKWKITDFNTGYKYCDTYPECLCVPSATTTQTLIGSCKFRSRARLPVLTYFHRPNAASISRCAQPLTGFSARCVEDEMLMDAIAKTNPSSSTLYLIDTRPKMNAMVNKMQGKGFENVRNYTNLRFHFFDIDNIHIMRTSLSKLLEACHRAKTVSDYYKQLEASSWLKHVLALLECGNFLAISIARGISCVVHCSDGWDRTAQSVSIAQILLDPFFRTIKGFQILIEKDWLGFGHKFDDRCGHIGAFNDEAAREVSPIFTQFLDATFQIMRQYPCAFEFNERYLIHMHEHAYSCQYGTFLGNCDKDRKDLNLAKRTQSLWAFLDDRHDDYINPLYETNKYGFLGKINLHPSTLVIWTAMYNRFDTGLLPRENTNDVALSTMEHVGILETHLASLQSRLAELKLGKQTPGSEVMSDSGHSSSISNTITPEASKIPERISDVTSLTHNYTMDEKWKKNSWDGGQNIQESGIYDALFPYNENNSPLPALRWQSIRSADECSNIDCSAEFVTRGERRLHCYRCGKIHCRRCMMLTSDGVERICIACSELVQQNSS